MKIRNKVTGAIKINHPYWIGDQWLYLPINEQWEYVAK